MHHVTLRRLLVGMALVTVCGVADFASAQNPWRTKYFRRDGLFHVEKYHTGNGLTPVGGAVLTTGITQFAPIVGAALGRDTPESANRDATTVTLPQDYITELSRANELLKRTEALVNGLPPATTTTPAPAQPTPVSSDDKGTPASPEFGSKTRWNPRP